MILGIGTDIVHISRIQRLLDRFGARFEEKIFTPAECTLARSRRDPAATYAKRWAAKEAFYKALGTGFRDNVSWHDTQVILDNAGKPTLQVTGESQKKLMALVKTDSQTPVIHLSLSDDPPLAQAFVIIEARTEILKKK